MGLAWQQGPLARGAIGTFLVAEPLPERLLYAEPLRRRMRVRCGGDVLTRWSCRTGVCHTCITPCSPAASPMRRPRWKPPADGQVLICCARPSTDIVLECKAWMRHEQADPARCAASVHRMPSAEAPRPGPDVFAVSPAIGPLPAIYASSSPSQATVPGLLRHATVRPARRAGGWAVRHLSRHGKYCQGGS